MVELYVADSETWYCFGPLADLRFFSYVIIDDLDKAKKVLSGFEKYGDTVLPLYSFVDYATDKRIQCWVIPSWFFVCVLARKY